MPTHARTPRHRSSSASPWRSAGLWKEAIYRWERATQIDPTYAAGFNNLAVAYEHEGMLDKAAEAYERALKLEPDNTLVRQNFELFKEIHDRSNQSQTP